MDETDETSGTIDRNSPIGRSWRRFWTRSMLSRRSRKSGDCSISSRKPASASRWGQAIVFTQFRATQERILRTLDQERYTTHAFHGGHSSDEKEAVIERFREEGGVLVSTDAMNEGRNLQFCNLMVNHDLPWNPMRVEQRIGRIHRIGQQRDVYVFNMVQRDD